MGDKASDCKDRKGFRFRCYVGTLVWGLSVGCLAGAYFGAPSGVSYRDINNDSVKDVVVEQPMFGWKSVFLGYDNGSFRGLGEVKDEELSSAEADSERKREDIRKKYDRIENAIRSKGSQGVSREQSKWELKKIDSLDDIDLSYSELKRYELKREEK